VSASPAAPHVSRAEFNEVFARCDSTGRWGPDDQRGALNYLTSADVAAAAALVRTGRTVSCGWDLDTVEGPDNPRPVQHRMTFGFDETFGDSGELRIAGDGFSMDIHGDAHSHVDALCHVGFGGRVYNGVSLDEAVGPAGALTQSVNVIKEGIVARGVLVDLPRFRGVPWIPPGEAVGPQEFLAAEEASGTRLRRGDLLLLRTGHSFKRATDGPWDAEHSKAGLQISVLPLLAERQIVGVGYDGDGEAVPSNCEGVAYPVHAISLPALGWWTMDSLNLDDLAAACEAEQRWEFMLLVAPLRLAAGTGSPVNPIAIF
jgi:kynurenine formamidase